MDLTPDQLKYYLEHNGSRCPFCHGRGIEGDSFDINGARATQEVHCPECNKQWIDVYTLTHAFSD